MDQQIESKGLNGCCDVAVVGAGPTGLAAALALTHVGAEVVLFAPPPLVVSQHPDTRTAALLPSSVDLLKTLKVWDDLVCHAAPLKAVRIIDATGNLLRGPDIEFHSSELGLVAFGYNIPNGVLIEALYARASLALRAIEPHHVSHIKHNETHAVLSCGDGRRLGARLLAGADGRHSICREQAGIGVSERRTAQAAIATSFQHTEPHRGVSTELHRRVGSVTTVPLTDPCASSLIWVGETVEIDDLMRLDETHFGTVLEGRLDGLLGRVDGVGARAYFPIAPLAAKTLTGRRTALVGEAAHILPPIGAQGLNLGLRDAATLADCVSMALKRGGDPGSEEVLSAYHSARRIDVLTRTIGIDLLNRSLLSGFLPLQVARGIVSYGLNALPPLRRFIMRIGMAPPTELPMLMRSAAH
jgi:2-octaprenyl-6-methoxyphenol hydroxylase